MTITQLIQSSPAKANELFAKLSDTSDGAVKTRERLFAELKAELELHARLEEEHLFPALRKHKETKDLVSEALADNKQARALLAELEQMPREGEDFLKKLGDLRKVFQQHVRDEKKELLPAVRKALSDEQAQAITEKIEADKAGAEEAKRDEAEKRRADMRREREAAERREADAEAKRRRARETAAELARSAESIENDGRRIVETGNAAATASAEAAAQSTRLTTDLANRTSQRATQNLEAFVQYNSALASGFQDISQEWLSFAQGRVRKNVDGLSRVLRCRTPQDFLAAQSELWRDNLEDMLDRSIRISEISAQIVTEATQKIQAANGGDTRRNRRA